MNGNWDRKAELLSAMANEKRLCILAMLVERNASVSEIAEFVELSPAAVSQHLRILRTNGMVRSRRSAQMIFYSDPSEIIRKIMAIFEESMPKTLPEGTLEPGATLAGK